MVEFIKITGPAYWAPYFINGDASHLEEGDKAKADAWLARNQVRIVGDATDDNGEPEEPRFTWSMQVHAPELNCQGGTVIDYIAESITPDQPEES